MLLETNRPTTEVKVGERGLITLPKGLRTAYGIQAGDAMTLIDLGGVFVLSRRRSEVDALADRIAADLVERGESLESLLKTLREERAKYDT